MKVLHIVKTSQGAKWAFEQAKKLKEKGIDIVTVLPDIKNGLANKYTENGMKLIELDCSLPIKKTWLIFKKIKDIKKIVEEEKPDMIHTHFVTNILMLRIALKKYDIPRIFQVPGPLHLEHFLYRKIEIGLSDKNDYWLPSCQKSQNIYLKEGVQPNKVFLAYYGGYGGKSIDEYEDSRNILHKEFDITKNDILIGMVSYFYKPKKYLFQTRGIKGHEDFIDAIKLLREKNKNIKGIIIGGAWQGAEKYEQKVKLYAKNKCDNNIIFTGFRNDLKKIYRELDVAVHPSHTENLGGAAESLAAGVPTIATNIGGFPDIVIDGETGYLCEVKNPKSIMKKTEKIMNSEKNAKEMSKKGKEKVKKMLDINTTTDNVILIYDKIMKGKISK